MGSSPMRVTQAKIQTKALGDNFLESRFYRFFYCSAEKALVSHLGCYFKRRLRGALFIVLTHPLLPNGRHHRAEIKTATKSSTAPCLFRLAISMRLCPMQSRVALAVRLAIVGDETKMRMMSIGGAGALQCRLR